MYHEQARINALIDDLLAHRDPALQIILVDGAPEQSTLQAVLAPVIKTVSEAGRAKQQNHGAKLAAGEILLFLHADTYLPQNAFQLIRQALQDPFLVGGAFDLSYDAHSWALKIIAKSANLRSRITRVPYGDQAIFVRRSVFEQLGCFAEIELMEDLEFMTRLRRQGHKIHIISEPVRTSPRRHLKEGILFCTLRNWLLRLCYHAGATPQVLASFYRKHQ